MQLQRTWLVVLVSLVVAAGARSQAADGSVKAQQKISALEGGMEGMITPTVGAFGHDLQTLGDLDGDGIRELAVGGPGCDDGGNARGSIWILFLDPDGAVRAAQKISETSGGFVGSLGHGLDGDQFGGAIASLGDLDGDGVGDLAAGTNLDDGLFDMEVSEGSAWIVFLKADGTVKAQQKIAEAMGGFAGELPEFGQFGWSVEGLGDLDLDGVEDLAVGARDASDYVGRIYVLFLDTDGTVKSQTLITEGQSGFTGDLDPDDHLSSGLAWLGDLNGDGVGDLAAGASRDDDGGPDRGAVWILFMRRDGTTKAQSKISSTAGGFTGELSDSAAFGYSVAPAGDVNGDGLPDLVVGAPYDSAGGPTRGSTWVLFLTAAGGVSGQVEISSSTGGFTGALEDFDSFGFAVDGLGDLDGDGVVDIASGVFGDDDGGVANGALWALFLHGAVTSTWTNLGQGLPGTVGLPELAGTGTLAPGAPVTLSLTQVKPFSPAFLIVSNLQLGLPFKGGTLVPAPSILFVIATDGFGGVQFSGATPPGLPPGFTHYFQFWIADAAGPAGFAASNGLAGTTPD